MNDNKGFQLASGAPEIYEKVLVPLWMERWSDILLELTELRPGEAVLDVACGTGVTTRSAKRMVGDEGHVTGLDINANMLAHAKTLAQGMDISWIESDVTQTELASNTYDAIIALHGYHYFPDKPGALAELRRTLVPNGRLVFTIWDGHCAYTSALCTAVERHISPDVADMQRSQRETPSAEELNRALADTGFKDIKVERRTLEIQVPLAREFVPLHLSSMPIAAAFHALTDTKKDDLIDEVEQALSNFVRGDQLVYPDTVQFFMGIK